MDCAACREPIYGDDVVVCCRGELPLDADHSCAHRRCAERIARELIRRDVPWALSLYDGSKDYYFCRDLTPPPRRRRLPEGRCLLVALTNGSVREDVRSAVLLAKTNRQAARQALTAILGQLTSYEARDQIQRAISKL